MMKDYDNEIDTRLVFVRPITFLDVLSQANSTQAGLFSAVLTAFIIDVYRNLDVDYTQDSATVLRQILAQLAGQTVNNIASSPPSATPSPTVIIVIVLWFVSLVFSLLSALFSISAKQWLHTYYKWTEVAHMQHGLILQGFYRANFNSWRVPETITGLGVLLQVALVLFAIGLVGYLWTLNFVVSSVLSVFALLMVVLSVLACPYKFPPAYVLLKFRTGTSKRDWTERDVPIAKRNLHLDEQQPALTRVIAQTALLLDIAPDQLELAIAPSPDIAPGKLELASAPSLDDILSQTIGLARGRVYQLSDELTALLSSIVTSQTILKGDPLSEDDDSRLLGLWRITLGPMARAPLTIFRAISYLEKRITEIISSDLAKKYVDLLVTFILPLCCKLSGEHHSFLPCRFVV
jgi:hypothetical protein